MAAFEENVTFCFTVYTPKISSHLAMIFIVKLKQIILNF